MVKSNLKALIDRAKPPHLKEIEAAIKNGNAANWNVEEAAAARAYLDRLQLSLEKKMEKDMQKPLKVAKFKGFARDLPKGTSISDIAAAMGKMKSQALGKGRIVPSLKVVITMKIIEHLSYCYNNAQGKGTWQVTSRQAVPVRVRSTF